MGIIAAPWPEADRLFADNDRWLGADGAYSIDLGNERTLWLLGDTFVGLNGGRTRRGSRMIRNSIGLQHGYDPTTASISFHWPGAADEPLPWFDEPGSVWRWPGAGVRVGPRVLVFQMRVIEIAATPPAHFKLFDYAVSSIDTPDDPPEQWHISEVPTPPGPPVVVGSAGVVVHAGFLYAYGQGPGTIEQPQGPTFLVRWAVEDAARGDLSRPTWWCRDGWRAWGDGCTPVPVFDDGQREFSVHLDERTRRLVQVQGDGLRDAHVSVRTAPRPEGPWSHLEHVFRPPEANGNGLLVYAIKAHAHLAADGAIAVTYVANSPDLGPILDDPAVYRPRFLTIRMG